LQHQSFGPPPSYSSHPPPIASPEQCDEERDANALTYHEKLACGAEYGESMTQLVNIECRESMTLFVNRQLSGNLIQIKTGT
jgi:hypothetical protein